MLESLEMRESEEPLGEGLVRCVVAYGPRLLEVRLGRGEYGLLADWGVEVADV